jgi:hypothetical protein
MVPLRLEATTSKKPRLKLLKPVSCAADSACLLERQTMVPDFDQQYEYFHYDRLNETKDAALLLSAVFCLQYLNLNKLIVKNCLCAIAISYVRAGVYLQPVVGFYSIGFHPS